MKKRKNKYNWLEVQKYHDEGNSQSECRKKFGMSSRAIFLAIKRGDFQARSKRDGNLLYYKKYGTKPLNEETKQKLRNTIAEKVKNNTWHYSFSKVRTHEFNSKYAGIIKVMGKWELAYAEYLDRNNIEWRRPNEKFYYEFSGLKSGKGYYIPDFYLIKEKVYVEVKGYETDKDRAKWKWFPKDLNHKVLKKKELEELGLVLSKR